MSPHSAGGASTGKTRLLRRSATVQARDNKTTDKRGRILEAAIKMFAERGFHAATVAGIAREAGVADGTIYLYFKSKEDLLLRLFDEKMTELTAEAGGGVERQRTAPEK